MHTIPCDDSSGNVTPAVQPDYAQASAYVAALTGGDPATVDIDARMIHDVRKDVAAIPLRGPLPQLWPMITGYQAQGYGAFININDMDGTGRELANVRAIRAHAVDLDNASALQNYQRAAAWSPPPSFAVQSSPGRFHVYWTVQPYVGGEQGNGFATSISRRLRQHFDGDKSVIDPSRVLRLPGTLHLKRPNAPHLVTCWSLSGFGSAPSVATLNDALASVPDLSIETGARHDLGDPSLAAPSLAHVQRALDLADPNDLDRAEWIAMLAAAKQAAWAHATPDEIDAMLMAWCARYDTDDPDEDRKQIASIRTTTLGWPSLVRRIPSLRAETTFGGIDRTGMLSGTASVPSRNIEDILNDAAKLTPDNADGAAALCREAGTLSPIHREMVLNAIRQATNIRIATLRAEASQAVNDTEADHLAIARMTLASTGVENAIHAENHFWLWEGRGVWNKRDDIAIKKRVQATLEANGYTVTAARVSGVTDVLRNEIYRPDHTFNIGNPDVVNCPNGELELGNDGWMLQPHRRGHYRTTQIPVAYDPNATAPMFLAFLHDVFRDDPDRDHKIWSLLELIGYTLMSHAKHERFIMLIGGGANGKSVLLSVIEALAGIKNVAGVQPANFQSRFQRAHLHQKLANIVTELKQGEIIADAELKAITSGELTTVEDKNGHPFEMRAFATCWFGTNHLPHTRDFSDALFRRSTIVTFNRTFSEAEQDHNLKTKLTAELPGILNLALANYARATMHGFIAPPSSIEAKRKWRMEADQVAQFVEEQCITDPTGIVAVDEIYRVFADWARRSGVRQIVGKQMMGDRMERLRFPRKRSNGSWITGLKLRMPVNYGSPP